MKIQCFAGVLSDEMCDRLISQHQSRLQPAVVGEGHKQHVSPGRCAKSSSFETEDWLQQLNLRLAEKLMGKSIPMSMSIPRLNSELVRYSVGDWFMRHRDAAKKDFTLIYFLNEGYHGGVLKFDDGLSFYAAKGSAVIWKNTDDSYHEVTEVLTGERYVLASWLGGLDA